MASVAIRKFGGMRADDNPHNVPPGLSLVQVNVDVVRPGEMRVRGGTRLVRFASPPKPSAPSWSQAVSQSIGFSDSTASVLFTTGFSRERNDTFSFSTSASSTVDKAQWSVSRSDTVGLAPAPTASKESGATDVDAEVSVTFVLTAAPDATSTPAAFESFTLMGLI